MRYKKLSLIIKPQTKTLLLIIIIGFMLTCLLSFIAINALKYEYDSNFTIHIKEIQVLRNAQDLYALNPSNNSSKQIREILQKILKQDSQDNLFYTLHNLYQKIFLPKSYENLQSLYHTQDKIIKHFYTHSKKLDELLAQKPQDPLKIDQKIKQMRSLISAIIDIRLQTASSQSQTIDSIYEATCVVLFIFIMIILLSIVFLAQSALSSLDLHEKALKQTIKDKTLELETINENLEKTIHDEVESSRQKDRIMYQQDRLASMGEMIQNIAHQWRQPLNSLMIIIQSFKIKFYNQKLDSSFIDSQTEYGLKIAKNMSETIENFRHFFQPNKLKEPFWLKESILDSIKLIEFVLNQNNIQVLTDFKCDYKIHGYKNAFSQVILNLLKNAQDAMIERQVKEGICEITLEEKYDKIIISLKDNAGGIKEKRFDKIFEPYFTTKHKSVGTGIGLFMTKEIIEKQMQGSIHSTNINWQHKNHKFYGAMFVIELPHPKFKTTEDINGKIW